MKVLNIDRYIANLRLEEKRNNEFLHVTANEARMSKTARSFLGSKLSERYFKGAGVDNIVDLDPFTLLGFPGAGELIQEAELAAKEMLGAKVINLNCLSGIHAMICAILSTTEPGDVVMSVNEEDGGHYVTSGILQKIGRRNIYADYNLQNLSFDIAKTAESFHKHKAKAFLIDSSYYINPHNLSELRRVLGKDAIIIYDASHTLGLIMGDNFQSPLLEGADVITANTHKTFPGPQKGLIAFKNKKTW